MSLKSSVRWARTDPRFHELHDVDFSPDGAHIAVGGGKQIFILDAEGELTTLIVYTSVLGALEWLHGASYTLVCGFLDGSVLNISISVRLIFFWLGIPS